MTGRWHSPLRPASRTSHDLRQELYRICVSLSRIWAFHLLEKKEQKFHPEARRRGQETGGGRPEVQRELALKPVFEAAVLLDKPITSE